MIAVLFIEITLTFTAVPASVLKGKNSALASFGDYRPAFLAFEFRVGDY